MKRKFISIFIMMLMCSFCFSNLILAGDEYNPEIVDEADDDGIVDYLDIISGWFYEHEEEPDFLFTGLKLNKINSYHFKQHLTIHWEHNGIPCASSLHIGYNTSWYQFSAGYGHGWWFQEHYQEIEGEFDEETGIIICKIPKIIINNPQKDDILTKTYALTFQRFGFIGRLGFDRAILRSIIYILTGRDLVDFAPESIDYGMEYTIQY